MSIDLRNLDLISQLKLYASTICCGDSLFKYTLEKTIEEIQCLRAQKAECWKPIQFAPINLRLIVKNDTEIAMGWLDEIDSKWYYSPNGGLIEWTPTHWKNIPQ